MLLFTFISNGQPIIKLMLGFFVILTLLINNVSHDFIEIICSLIFINFQLVTIILSLTISALINSTFTYPSNATGTQHNPGPGICIASSFTPPSLNILIFVNFS